MVYLCRAGFYPPNGGITLDFTISKKITNYVLVVSVNQQGEVTEVTVES
jgi:Protein of unknown function (DUF2004)